MRLEISSTPRSFASIDAILILRELGGLSLKEAKAAIESAMRRQAIAVSVVTDEAVAPLRALGVECRILPSEE